MVAELSVDDLRALAAVRSCHHHEARQAQHADAALSRYSRASMNQSGPRLDLLPVTV
jgi:hypothetical protein